MAATLVVATLRLVLHDVNFLRTGNHRDCALDLRAFDRRRADGRVHTVVYEENLVKNDRITLLQVAGELFNRNCVAFGDDKLLPARLNYGHFHSGRTVAPRPPKDKAAEADLLRPWPLHSKWNTACRAADIQMFVVVADEVRIVAVCSGTIRRMDG